MDKRHKNEKEKDNYKEKYKNFTVYKTLTQHIVGSTGGLLARTTFV